MATTAFPRWLGDGQGAFVWDAVHAISKLGVQVRVVAMHSPGVLSYEIMEGVEIRRPRYWWPERHEILRKESGGLPVVWRRYPLARVQILALILFHATAIARCARTCDLIHANWSLSAAASLLVRWSHHRPIVATLQGSDLFQVTRSWLGSALTRRTLARCDQITVLSRALADRAAAVGVPAGSIRIIPNGVDTNKFVPVEPSQRGKLILFVGSLIERKGVRYLLAAMPEVVRAFGDHRLVIVGEGSQHSELQQLAQQVGIADRVDFVGFQGRDAVRAWLQRADLFVLPSIEEGLGVVLLEAMSCGTPVVASRVDGIPDVVTSEVGTLVPSRDPAALSEAIVRILGDRSRWMELSRGARQRAVSCYDWNRIAPQFIDLYREALVHSARTA